MCFLLFEYFWIQGLNSYNLGNNKRTKGVIRWIIKVEWSNSKKEMIYAIIDKN
ncbi:hypothetical protein SAMN04488098_101028 [Alkalibacterium thalassium]|uniref:Uncharacterized protein n=1 Tax=Alkalibacterium thalassium TaxID=426701 RepID=A0A1G8YKS0_9LACT|nr:hypothetical protein SAMN04488098_101028 [Alkalibacterium thalassium]